MKMIVPYSMEEYKTRPFLIKDISKIKRDIERAEDLKEVGIMDLSPSDDSFKATLTGKLGNIYPSFDVLMPKTYHCKDCGCSEAVFRFEMGTYSAEEDDIKPYCRDCWRMYRVEEPMVEESYFDYTSQLLELVDDNHIKKVNVLYISKNEALSKKDIGREITVSGGLWYGNKSYQYNLLAMDLEKPTFSDEEPEPVEHSRDIPGYDEWRQTVISRDKKCVVCGGTKHLNAHHIYGYKEYPNLRTDTNNGVSVCKFCHDKYHSYFGIKEITPIKFIQFLRQFMVR